MGGGGSALRHRLVFLGWTRQLCGPGYRRGAWKELEEVFEPVRDQAPEDSKITEQSPSVCQEARLLSTWSQTPKLAGIQSRVGVVEN